MVYPNKLDIQTVDGDSHVFFYYDNDVRQEVLSPKQVDELIALLKPEPKKDNRKIYMTSFSMTRYFRANSPDEARAALATILKGDVENAGDPVDQSLEQMISTEPTEGGVDITEDMIEDADDYLTGA